MTADLIAKIFDPIAKMLRAEFDGIYVTGEYVDAPPRFPAVSIVEADNYLDADKMSSSADEEYSIVMYEVEVYTNLETGKQMRLDPSDYLKRHYGFMTNILSQMENFARKYLWDHDLMNMCPISKKNMDEKT